MKKNLLALALFGCLGAAVAAPGDPITLLPTAPGMFGASFTQTVDDGSLIDTFGFTPGAFSGFVAVSLKSLTGPVVFLNGQINDVGFGNLSDDPFNFSFQTQVSADTPLTVTVQRAVFDADMNLAGTGSYGVSINAVAAAVPEPETWALLMTGLLAVGLATGRRRSKPSR